ncbi:phenylacetic acid degradation operon negative regulatory protein PaaX [Ferviditalea candida]|uniref:Phenylacetic acid degradation operon negative regulatory protein PaaX n=1 Tax=Ferviditalea candida TaxID=3108399 RepID=A0ABU5ZCC4_9BACL|nr:phenylacetic acid degradation operon negative regulatory protein PaaX [Paenibacillaceae bacterium T2]
MKPRSLMFTLFGDFIRYYGGEIWIGSLIRMMSEFGISESSVRGATLRMVQQDLLKVRRVGNKSYYSLTDKGKRRIEDGVRRVYSVNNHKWDGYWRILTYSVPEEKRDLRNQIRKELLWTGFGLMSNGTWVSPNPLEEQIMEMVRTYDLYDYTMLFSSASVISHDNQYIIEKGWNLHEIQSEYQTFIETYKPKYEQLKDRVWDNTLTDVEAFVERIYLVHIYRKFLFKDPGFPMDFLPSAWNGNVARDLFWHIHQLISTQAVRYFESVFEHAPDIHLSASRERAINPFAEVYL